jgi:hypothetical protein
VERRKIKDVNSIECSIREKKYKTYENLPEIESKNSYTKTKGVEVVSGNSKSGLVVPLQL